MRKQIGRTTVDVYPPENPKFKSRLILIHGLWNTSSCWEPWATRLTNLGRECWAVNLGDRIGGVTGEGVAQLSLERCVEELKQVIQAAGPDPVIVAHDMGWVPSLKACHGERLAGLVLISPPDAGLVPKDAARTLRLLKIKYFLLVSLGWPVRIREKDFSRYWLSCLAVSRQLQVLKALVPESSHLVKLLFGSPLTVHRGPMGWPVLVMGGTEDPVAPLVSVRKTAAILAAQFREYPGHGHWLLEEEGWEEVVNDVHRWLVQELGEAALLNPPKGGP